MQKLHWICSNHATCGQKYQCMHKCMGNMITIECHFHWWAVEGKCTTNPVSENHGTLVHWWQISRHVKKPLLVLQHVDKGHKKWMNLWHSVLQAPVHNNAEHHCSKHNNQYSKQPHNHAARQCKRKHRCNNWGNWWIFSVRDDVLTSNILSSVILMTRVRQTWL